MSGGSEDCCTVQCKIKWPSASDLCITMFTVPSARLCFDNLSSQNSPRKGSSVGLHKCMHTHAHTQIRRTRQTEWWMEEAASETTIRGTESDQRRTTEGRNHRGRPQTGRQRKPRHGSGPRGAYQISVQTSLTLWPLLLLLCAPFLLSVLFTAMFELLCVFFLAVLLNELKSFIQFKKKKKTQVGH